MAKTQSLKKHKNRMTVVKQDIGYRGTATKIAIST